MKTKKQKLIICVLSAILFGFGVGDAKAASITSAQSGNWSDASTWVGAAVPGDGDRATIATGHTVTVNADTTVGNSTAAIGTGVTINATDATTYGKIIVGPGVKFTLRGYDLANSMMLISRYAVFEPQPGAMIIGDISGNGATGIENNGIINAVGTAQNPIIFTIPISDRANPWTGKTATKVDIVANSNNSNWIFDGDRSIAATKLSDGNIANTEGTNIATLGDHSVTFLDYSPNMTPLTAEKAAIDEITAAGDYYLEPLAGVVYYYHNYAIDTPKFDVSYTYLNKASANWKGWYINSTQDTTYNEAKFDHCIFEYMGKTYGNNKPALMFSNKKSASVEANRIFYLKNSTLKYCGYTAYFSGNNAGTTDDPLLVINNSMYGIGGGGGLVGDAIGLYGGSYMTFDNNNLYGSSLLGGGTNGQRLDGIKITNNTTHSAGTLFYDFIPVSTWLADGEISGNVVNGIGGGLYGGIGLMDLAGYPDHNVKVHDNVFNYVTTCIAVDRHAEIYNNVFNKCYHAGIRGQIGSSEYAPDVSIHNNIFLGPSGAGAGTYYYLSVPNAAIALYGSSVGYDMWIDNWQIYNNTIVNSGNGGLSMGGAVSGSTLITRSSFYNNLITKSTNGFYKYSITKHADNTTNILRGVMSLLDYNLMTPALTATYSNLNSKASALVTQGSSVNYNTSGTRNIPGVEIGNPSYTTDQAGRSLALAVTNPNDMTLKWGAGDPVQLVWQADGSTMTSASTQNMVSGATIGSTKIYDSSKNWSNDKTSVSSPAGRWLKITSGAGEGEGGRKYFFIINNGTNYVNVLPPLTTPTAIGDTYEIINSEVKLFDTAGSTGGSIDVGIRLEDLPTTSQTDAGILFTYHTLTSSPLLTNDVGVTFADMVLQAGSPAIGAGLNGAAIGYTGNLVADMVAPAAPSGLNVM